MFDTLRGESDLLFEVVDVAHEQSEAVGLVERLLLVVGEVIHGLAAFAYGGDADPVGEVRGYEVQHFERLLVVDGENLMPALDLKGVILPAELNLLVTGLECDAGLPDLLGAVVITLDERLAVIGDIRLQETAVGVPARLEVAIDVVTVILVGIVLLKAELLEQLIRLGEQGLQDRISVAERLLRLQIDDSILERFRLTPLCNLLGVEGMHAVDLPEGGFVAALLNQFGGIIDMLLCCTLLLLLGAGDTTQHKHCDEQGDM